ncbi:MAG: glycerol-3-phosphate dehydrogenase [Gammaproteobacteria bacterium]|nr:glycerol-3-phosphate dehydrogenase [Gammaproteobacteria bacterium]NIR81763.1 glycerol-3-phosphate dehydrogenase [Gammaproteobacteria bacterium]NIR88566.1 glycerol-3-phosphate dehydrogenase [Gammaproteobacteria bacterium]NIU02870.1 glycerol-3-phosphate dehydrogenase [Gammaproteobacteria bacterium]NIV50392.1 glycerol-3-phosphate dehydrogenase [Gammaproteobacteria bacterium]
MADCVDVLVIGGGINGAAVARDAAGRGLSVYLAERDDYGSATSSASSKLIHGGLRYLEQYDFRLVYEALHEREVLMRIAPHLVFPLRFLLPVTRGAPRPVWMVRLGLWLYDVLSGRRAIEPAGRLDDEAVAALPNLRRTGLRAVLHYPDCWADDSRLVLETLLDARARGADIGNYREVVALRPDSDGYVAEVAEGGRTRSLRARFVVNAGGPWANHVLDRMPQGAATRRGLRLDRGSHVVVRSPEPDRDYAYTLQNHDGRVVFVLPWQKRYLIIGTTDVMHEGDPGAARCTDAERDYLIDCYNAFFEPPLRAQDVIWSYAGVRPLIDDAAKRPSEISRDYTIHTQRHGRGALLTVYGGKLSIHRRLGERVVAELARFGVELPGPWTQQEPVHGGVLDRGALAALARSGPRSVSDAVRARWSRTYGSCVRDLYDRIGAEPGTAREIAPGIPEVELIHAVETEDVHRVDDFLYRRTKLFLGMGEHERDAVAGWFVRHAA